MRNRKIFFFAAAIFFIACHADQPLTPEETVRLWQQQIDKNQFDEARKISSGQAKDYIDYLANAGHSDTISTELLQLHCDIRHDSAVCTYNLEDEIGEKIQGNPITLKKAGKTWMVVWAEGFDRSALDTLKPGDEKILFPADSTDKELE